MTELRNKILDQLDLLQTLLESTTCDGENYSDNKDEYDDWAAEIDVALETLRDTVARYVD